MVKLPHWIALTCLLTTLVITLGAYTRLENAGLGCPDWPGCYGQWWVPSNEQAIAQANHTFPERPFEASKAWPEMIHRYLASLLGLSILLLTINALSARFRHMRHASSAQAYHAEPPAILLPLVLLIGVVLQGLLGMWTVTLQLYPLVVLAHLIGGFTTLCLLALYYEQQKRCFDQQDHGYNITQPYRQTQRSTTHAHFFVCLGIALLSMQIIFGGWTAANYAAAVCTEGLICQAGWQAQFDWTTLLGIAYERGFDYEFAPHLSSVAKLSIHILHRIGALIVCAYFALLALYLLKQHRQFNMTPMFILGYALLLLQVTLGAANVLLNIPLLVAVAHNLCAALLLSTFVRIAYRLQVRQHSPAQMSYRAIPQSSLAIKPIHTL